MDEDKEKNLSISSQGSPWAVPGAIIIAGLLIAGAVLYGGGSGNLKKEENSGSQGEKAVQQASALDNMNPVTEKDHILGDVNAPVKIVEYSDLECPFCKRFHQTTKQIMDEYGKSGEVALVFRHFPLAQLHSKAPKEAEATECAAELGGNASFWAYVDRLFEITPSNNRLELSQLPEIAAYIGLDKTKFSICLESGKYADKVAKDLANAAATGGRGTPWSIVVARDGSKYPINGALPFSQVKTIIEAALK